MGIYKTILHHCRSDSFYSTSTKPNITIHIHILSSRIIIATHTFINTFRMSSPANNDSRSESGINRLLSQLRRFTFEEREPESEPPAVGGVAPGSPPWFATSANAIPLGPRRTVNDLTYPAVEYSAHDGLPAYFDADNFDDLEDLPALQRNPIWRDDLDGWSDDEWADDESSVDESSDEESEIDGSSSDDSGAVRFSYDRPIFTIPFDDFERELPCDNEDIGMLEVGGGPFRIAQFSIERHPAGPFRVVARQDDELTIELDFTLLDSDNEDEFRPAFHDTWFADNTGNASLDPPRRRQRRRRR